MEKEIKNPLVQIFAKNLSPKINLQIVGGDQKCTSDLCRLLLSLQDYFLDKNLEVLNMSTSIVEKYNIENGTHLELEILVPR